MLLRKAFVLSKSVYRQKQKRLFLKKKTNWEVLNSIMTLAKYNIVLTIRDDKGNVWLTSVFYKAIPLVYDISFFKFKSQGISISVASLKRLTYLTPSCFFFISTKFGVITHHELFKYELSGRLVALCVIDEVKP